MRIHTCFSHYSFWYKNKDNYDEYDENYNALKIKVNLKEITNFRNALYNGGSFLKLLFI